MTAPLATDDTDAAARTMRDQMTNQRTDPATTPLKKSAASATADADGRSPPQARRRKVSPAAERALAEAEERRREAGGETPALREIGGRGGLDPVRYGDWEIKGRAIDF